MSNALTKAFRSSDLADIDFNAPDNKNKSDEVNSIGFPLVYRKEFPKDTDKPILIKNYQKIKIKQDKKKGVTIASIDLDDLENEFRIPYHPKLREHKCIRDIEDSLWGQVFHIIGAEKERFFAITHCAKGDTWDDLKGVQVAREKLSAKVYKVKLKAIKNALNRIEMLKEPLEALKEDTEYKAFLIKSKNIRERFNNKVDLNNNKFLDALLENIRPFWRNKVKEFLSHK